MRLWLSLLRLGWLGLAVPGTAAPALVMAIDNATEMPMARVKGNTVVGGMNYDLGGLLAKNMGRDIRYLAVPRKRVVETLQNGDADFACTYMPHWLPGPLQWSQAFFRQDEVIATRVDTPAPHKLADLKGKPIGTVHGFVYAELEKALGADFVRADAPNAAANLRKLAAGRLDHVSVEGRMLTHVVRRGEPPLRLHPRLHMMSLLTHCALGPSSRVSLIELNHAIETIQRDGSLQLLYEKYD